MSALPTGFTIRRATDREVEQILSEPRLVQKLGPNVDYSYPYWLCLYLDYVLLFEFWQVEEGLYEVHIAVPRSSIVASRALILGGLNWLFSVGASDCDLLQTTCPKGKISNMLRKLGWTNVSPGASELQTFLFTKSQLLI
jgi:hypothetical protein